MRFVLLPQSVKKRDWLTGVSAAFFLTAADCLFENRDISLIASPAFVRFLLPCAVFFGAAGCAFVLKKPWVPLGLAVGGAVLAAVCSRAWAPAFLFVWLPAALLLSAPRVFPADEKRTGRVYAGLSALFLAGTAALVRSVFFSGSPLNFFDRNYNSRLNGFFPLLLQAAFCVTAAFTRLKAGRAEPPEKNGKKKTRGKTAARPDASRWVGMAPAVLFFVNAALCYVLLWQANESFLPYPLLLNAAALCVLLDTLTGQRPAENGVPPVKQIKNKQRAGK